MLIRILGPVDIESKPGFSQQFAAGEFVDIPGGLAYEAIQQGAAVAATIDEARAASAPAPIAPNPESEPEAPQPRAKAQKSKKES